MSQRNPNGGRAPDFFLVGAPKCATSSLHLLLIRHPDVFMCDPKEPHFFSTDLPGLPEVADRQAYDALFADAPADAKWGDASAFYLSSTAAAGAIYNANPDAKIIASIRNPVDAAVSLFHQLRDGFREDQTRFEDAWALQAARAGGQSLPAYCPEPRQLQYQNVYSYHDQIVRYFDQFGRDAVKVFLFEDVTRTPGPVIDELLTFIGVDADRVPAEMPRTNSRRAARFPGLTQMITSPPRPLRPLVAPVKAVLNRMGVKPSEVIMKYLSRPATKDEVALAADFRREVQSAFAGDVARLEQLLDRDLSGWMS